MDDIFNNGEQTMSPIRPTSFPAGNPGKKVLILSDLHADLWNQEQERAFDEFVRYATSEAKEVIFLGDLLDLPSNDMTGLTRGVKTLGRCFGKLRDHGLKITLISGNHDVMLGLLPIALPKFVMLNASRRNPYQRLLGGRVVYLEHGHHYDPLCRSGLYGALFVVESLFQFNSNLIGSVLLDKIRKHVPELRHIEPPAHRPGLPDVINQIWENAAQDILNRFHCEGVLFGHTHTPQVTWFTRKQFYLNTGTWLDLSTYVEADEDSLILKDWSTGRVFGEITPEGPAVAPYCSRTQGARPGMKLLRPAS